MGASGARAATFYNETTGDYITLQKLTPDSDYLNEGIAEEDLDGNEVYVEERALLNLGFYDNEDAEQFRTWMRNRDKVKAVIYGKEDYIFWDEESNVRLIEPAKFQARQRNIRRVTMQARGNELDIQRTLAFALVADGQIIDGIVGISQDEDGVTGRVFPPGEIGSDSELTWMGETMEFVTITTG